MATNKNKPENCMFVCSRCPKRAHFVSEVRTVAMNRLVGWSFWLGESRCDECTTAEIVGGMALTVAANEKKGRAA
jgi:hypothetical protein